MSSGVTNVLILALFVLIFGSILRRRASSQLQFWFLGGLPTLISMVTTLVPFVNGTYQTAARAVSLSALELGGICFLVAVSRVFTDLRKRRALLLLISLPALTY